MRSRSGRCGGVLVIRVFAGGVVGGGRAVYCGGTLVRFRMGGDDV